MKRILIIIVAISLFISSVMITSASISETSFIIEDATPYIASRPTSICSDGVTYFVFMKTEPTMIQIISFNEYQGEWSSIYNVGYLTRFDYHSGPAIGILPDKRLVVFYLKDLSMFYRVSKYSTIDMFFDASKLSEWDSEISFNRLVPESKVYTMCPQLMTFEDKLVLFISNQLQWYNVTWWRTETVNGKDWAAPQEIFTHIADGEYMFFTKVESKILMTGFERVSLLQIIKWVGKIPIYKAGAKHRNLYFAYSLDEGNSWMRADGSSLSIPMNENAKILDSPMDTRAYSVILDKYNKPVIHFTYRNDSTIFANGTHTIKVASYSGTLGSNGSWKMDDVLNEECEEVITGFDDGIDAFLSILGEPAFYARILTDSNTFVMERLTRISDYSYKSFVLDATNITQTVYSSSVWDTAKFEMMTNENGGLHIYQVEYCASSKISRSNRCPKVFPR